MPYGYDPRQYMKSYGGIAQAGQAVASAIPGLFEAAQNKHANADYYEDAAAQLQNIPDEIFQKQGTTKENFLASVEPLKGETNLKYLSRFAQAVDPLKDDFKAYQEQTQGREFATEMSQPRQVQAIPPQEAGAPPPEVGADRQLAEGQAALPTPPQAGVYTEAPRTEEDIYSAAREQGLGQRQIESPYVQQQLEQAKARDEAAAVVKQEVGEKLKSLEETVQKELSGVTARTIGGKGIAIDYSISEADDMIKEKEKALKSMLKNMRKEPAKAGMEAQQLGIPPTLEAAQAYQDELMQQRAGLDAEKKSIQERLKALQGRFAEDAEAERKAKAVQRATTGNIKAKSLQLRAAKDLSSGLNKMAKQQFPDLYKVTEGEYGIEVMKRTSGIANAARSIMQDPKKRIALAYAFPDETGTVARFANAPRPPQEEIDAVLQEMQMLQDQVYGIVQEVGPSTGTTGSKFTIKSVK